MRRTLLRVAGTMIVAATAALCAAGAFADVGKPEWERFYRDPGDGVDQACAALVDETGAVYLAVATWSYAPYALLKYDGEGRLVWRQSVPVYNTGDPWCFMDWDAQGNLVFGGTLLDAQYNLFAAAYDRDGPRLWLQVFDPEGANAFIRAMAADGEGGGAMIADYWNGGPMDWAIARWTSGGVEEWIGYFTGPGGLNDYAQAVAVDADGAVLAAGTACVAASGGECAEYRAALAKFDAAGNQSWVAYGDAPGWGQAVAVDAAENAYLLAVPDPQSPAGAYTLYKFDTGGALQWKAVGGKSDSYAAAAAMALDPTGNPVVAAAIGAGWNTVKHAAADGDAIWSRQYAPAAAEIRPSGLVFVKVDPEGTVRVAGGGFSIVAYDADGVQLWDTAYGDAATATVYALATAPNGRTALAGVSTAELNDDAVAVLLDEDGAATGGIRYHGPGASKASGVALAIDVLGNPVVAGTARDTGATDDFLALRYGPNGQLVQKMRFDSSYHGDDELHALVRDAAGNMLVVGVSQAFGLRSTVAAKYSARGGLMWSARNTYFKPESDKAPAATVDAEGNLIIAGPVRAAQNDRAAGALKYSPSGALLWRGTPSAQTSIEDVVGVAADTDGDVLVLAAVSGDAALSLKYDADGNKLWEQFWDDFTPWALLVDGAGGGYVAGAAVSGSGMTSDYRIFKHDAAGDLVWERQWADQTLDLGQIVGLAFGPDGLLFAAGYGERCAIVPKYQWVVLKTGVDVFGLGAAHGETRWTVRTDTRQIPNYLYPPAIAADPTGGLFLAAQGRDGVIAARYGADGAVLDQWRQRGDDEYYDLILAAAVNRDGTAYAAGTVDNGSPNQRFQLLKFVSH